MSKNKPVKKKAANRASRSPVVRKEPPEAPTEQVPSVDNVDRNVVVMRDRIVLEENTVLEDKPIIEEKGPTHSNHPVALDPELIARAKNYGFSDQQIKGYTTNGALQNACDRCRPPVVVTGREGKPEPKPRRLQPNQVPSGCKDYPIHIRSVTEKERIPTRNRLAYDHGIAQGVVLSFVRAHRQEGQVFCKKIVYSQDNQPNEKGELVTDIDIVMAV